MSSELSLSKTDGFRPIDLSLSPSQWDDARSRPHGLFLVVIRVPRYSARAETRTNYYVVRLAFLRPPSPDDLLSSQSLSWDRESRCLFGVPERDINYWRGEVSVTDVRGVIVRTALSVEQLRLLPSGNSFTYWTEHTPE